MTRYKFLTKNDDERRIGLLESARRNSRVINGRKSVRHPARSLCSRVDPERLCLSFLDIVTENTLDGSEE